MPVIRASCLTPAPWPHNSFMILFSSIIGIFDGYLPQMYKKNPKLSNFFLRIFVSDSLRNDGDVISVLQK